MPADDITVQQIPALGVVAIGATAPTFHTADILSAVNQAAIRFDELAIRKLVDAQGPLMIFFEHEEGDDVTVYVALEVPQEPAELPSPASYRVLPGIEAAVAVRNGAAAAIFPDVVNDLVRWVTEQGYQPCGTNR